MNKNTEKENEREKERENQNLSNEIYIKCINIQGLTKQKYLEIEREIDNKTIMCLVETQEKFEKIIERDNLEKHVSRRKMEDKKGGGIMILKKKDNNIKIEKIKNEHPDILATQCQTGNLEFVLMVTYISCNPKENLKIYEEIDKILKKKY